MIKYLKDGILRALMFAVAGGGITYGAGFLGIGCVQFMCGSCIKEATYQNWNNTAIGIAIFIGALAGVYGLIAGIAESKSTADSNLKDTMERWDRNANAKIKTISELLTSNHNANNNIKECMKFINTREKWMSKNFIKTTVEPKMTDLRKVIFRTYTINKNVNGVYELEKLVNVLKARDTFKGTQEYKENIENINEMIKYINNTSNMVSTEPYGKMKKEFSDKLEKYKNIKNELYQEIVKEESLLYGDIIRHISILKKEFFEKLEVCLYFASHESPYNADRFNKIQRIYDNFKNKYINIQNYSRVNTITFKAPDSLYTEMYTYKMMGETVLKNNKKQIIEQIQNRINYNEHKEISLFIAAGLMNIGLYDIEKEILTFYVSQGLNVSATIQKRIKYLETDTRNGKIGVVHEVDMDGFAYDFASSNWSDDDIQAFFKNLAYQEKKLNYSLVIEDWKKTLPMSGKMKISDEVICEELSKMLDSEYDNEVTCKVTKTIALAESSFEEQKAILFTSASEEYNKEITFILSCIKVGKSLSIRIFTLFTPNPNKSTEEDLKEAITIKKGLNPRNTAYIEGLRESILRKMESYLTTETTSNEIY